MNYFKLSNAAAQNNPLLPLHSFDGAKEINVSPLKTLIPLSHPDYCSALPTRYFAANSMKSVSSSGLPKSPVFNCIKDAFTGTPKPPNRPNDSGEFKVSNGPAGRMVASSIAHVPNTTFIKGFNNGDLADYHGMTTKGMGANAFRILLKWSVIEQLTNQYRALISKELAYTKLENKETKAEAIATCAAALTVGLSLAPIERLRSVQAASPTKLSTIHAFRSMIQKGGAGSLFRGWQMNAFDSLLLAATPTDDVQSGLLMSVLLSPARTVSYSLRFKQQVSGINLKEAALATLNDVKQKPRVFIMNGIGHSILHGPIYQGVLCASIYGLDKAAETVKSLQPIYHPNQITTMAGITQNDSEKSKK